MFFLCDGWIHFVVVVIFKEHGEHLLRRIAFGTTESVGAGEDVLCDELIQEMVTLAVASQYSSRFPEFNVVQKLTP